MSSKASEAVNSFPVGRTESGRVFQSGVIRLNSPEFQSLTMMILGRYYPFSEATFEGNANARAAVFVLDHLNDIITRSIGKLLLEKLIRDISELSPEICIIFDTTQYIYQGANVDFAVKFVKKASIASQNPEICNVMFHLPRDKENCVLYQPEGMLFIANQE